MIESLDKGISLHLSGQLDKAKKIYENIIQSETSNFQAIHLLGVIFFQKKNYSKSIELIKNSININPKNFTAYNNLGNVFKELRKYSDAIINYNKAVEINPNYSGCLYNLAKTHASISNYELALNFYKKSIASNPNFLDAYYDYAELLEILGSYDQALENYYKLQKLKNNYPCLKSSIVHLKLKICQWENLEEEIEDIKNSITKELIVNPFHVTVITDSSMLQKIAIEKYSQYKFPEINISLSSETDTSSSKKIFNKKKIKIGYYCADVSNHPIGVS